MAKRELTPAQKANLFRPGVSGNPGGISAQVRAQMAENGRKATALRTRLLNALESRIEGAVRNLLTDEEYALYMQSGQMNDEAAARVLSYLSGDVNRLLTDTENRGFGNPTQPTRNDDAPPRQIDSDMTPEEAAEAYAKEMSGGGS